MTTTTASSIDLTTDWAARAAGFAAEIRDGAALGDVTGQFPVEAFGRLRDAGFTAALVPADLGGGGATHAEMAAILRTFGAADPAVAVALSMHSHLVAAQVWRHRHGQDARAVLEKVAGGAVLVSTGASDWLGSNGTARRVDGGYVVSARKTPASGCEVGDVLVTSIRWDDAPDGPQVIHGAIPFSAEGVSIEMTWDTLGMRATGSHTVVLDEVFLPDGAVALVRPADAWHPVWNTIMGAAMPLIMSAYVGVADAAVDLALGLVRGRTEPHVLQLAGEMVNAHVLGSDLVDAMVASSGDLWFDNTDQHASVTLARKTVAADALIETVRRAVELSGGIGYARSSALERLYRDVHGCLFHPLPRARQTTLSGRVALGMVPVG